MANPYLHSFILSKSGLYIAKLQTINMTVSKNDIFRRRRSNVGEKKSIKDNFSQLSPVAPVPPIDSHSNRALEKNIAPKMPNNNMLIEGFRRVTMQCSETTVAIAMRAIIRVVGICSDESIFAIITATGSKVYTLASGDYLHTKNRKLASGMSTGAEQR